MLGQRFAGRHCGKRGNKRFQHKGRFTRARNTRYRDKAPFGKVDGEGLYRV